MPILLKTRRHNRVQFVLAVFENVVAMSYIVCNIQFPEIKSMNYVNGRPCCERENNQLALGTDSLVSLVEP